MQFRNPIKQALSKSTKATLFLQISQFRIQLKKNEKFNDSI